MSVLPRQCRECRRTFLGGPRAWYCPVCRKERQMAQKKKHKARKRRGETRPLGSQDVCIVCGNPYEVTGPNQRYCPKCSPDAVAEVDRRQGLDYYKAKRNEINPVRNVKRRHMVRHCALCCREFTDYGNAKYCSDSCRAEGRHMAQLRADAKRRGKPEPVILQPPRNIDWSNVDWWLTDTEIAHALGCTRQRVWAARKRLQK